MKYKHLFTFCTAAVVAWVLGTCAFIYFYPHMFYNVLRRAVVERGLGIKAGGIPVNTLYAMPALASPSLSKSSLVRTGNRDTLYTVGGLDLSKGPQVLHVPDMDGRYYSIEFADPWLDIFACVGRRTTGTKAGDYVISAPDWRGTLPEGVSQILSPSDRLLLIGRVLVYDDSDLATAYNLAKQIQLTALSISPSGHPVGAMVFKPVALNHSATSSHSLVRELEICRPINPSRYASDFGDAAK